MFKSARFILILSIFIIKNGISQCTQPPKISYNGISNNYVVGSIISNLLPTNSGGKTEKNGLFVSTLANSDSLGFGPYPTLGDDLIGIVLDKRGNITFCDNSKKVIRKINQNREISTFAGPGTLSYGMLDTVMSTLATLGHLSGIVMDGNKNIYFTNDNDIYKINVFGLITKYAGLGYAGNSTGTISEAAFDNPLGLTIDKQGNLYIVDTGNNCIKKISKSGIVSIIAGNGTDGYADGIGSSAMFSRPDCIIIDKLNNLYIGDNGNLKIRKISANGLVTTFADLSVSGLAIDESGYIYASKWGYSEIVKISPKGNIGHYFGNGYGQIDGDSLTAKFYNPESLILDSIGNLYIQENNSIRKISERHYSVSPSLPSGLELDPYSGEIYGNPKTVTPLTSYTILTQNTCGKDSTILSFSTCQTPSISFQSNDTIVCSSGNVMFSIQASGSNLSYQWLKDATIINGETSSTLSLNNLSELKSGIYTCVVKGDCGTLTSKKIILKIIKSSPIISYVNTSSKYVTLQKITPIQLVNSGGEPKLKGRNVLSLPGTFNSPRGIIVDKNENVIIANYGGNDIRKISSNGTVSIISGAAGNGFLDGNSSIAKFSRPFDVDIDHNGNIFVADNGNNKIRKITPDGIVSTFAGSTSGYALGKGIQSQFLNIQELCIDKNDNIFVVANNRVRKITAEGDVVEFSGRYSHGDAMDGSSSSAVFKYPLGVTVDANGNVYLSDNTTNKIKKIDSTGWVFPLAGKTDYSGGFSDGIGENAQFNWPNGVTVDSLGNVFVADYANHRIRKITQKGEVTTIANNLSSPSGIALGKNGDIYVSEYQSGTIKKLVSINYSISPSLPAGLEFAVNTGIITGTPTEVTPFTTYTITSQNDCGLDSTKISFETCAAPMITSQPTSIKICEGNNSNITVLASGTNLTFQWKKNGKDIIGATSSTLTFNNIDKNDEGKYSCLISNNCSSILSDSVDVLFSMRPKIKYSNTSTSYLPNSPIPIIVPTNSGNNLNGGNVSVSTIAGIELAGLRNGPALQSVFNHPIGITVDSNENIFIADYNNYTVRKINKGDSVSSIGGFSKDVAIDLKGNIFYSDWYSKKIMKINNSGVTTTYAGSDTPNHMGGYLDGPSSLAQFIKPSGITTDYDGNVYVIDGYDAAYIRKIGLDSSVTTIAGSNLKGYQDGVGINAKFNLPTGIAIDKNGFIYIADSGNHRIRKITPNGTVSTFAGSTQGYSDGTISTAKFNSPSGVIIDSLGFIYIADSGNNRIRKISPNGDVSNLSGDGSIGRKDGLGLISQFSSPYDLTIDKFGTLFIADYNNNSIRKISQLYQSIQPNLPKGLNFDRETGEISGIPQSITPTKTYTIYSKNYCGVDTTTISFSITDTCTPPKFNKLLTDTSVCVNSSFLLSTNVSGTGLIYQWKKGNNIIPNANSAILKIPNVSLNDSGYYKCLISGNCGDTIIDSFFITVNSFPKIEYFDVSKTYLKDTSVQNLIPKIEGGSLQITTLPLLPTGLSINSSTGEILGFPSQITQNISYKVTAQNICGVENKFIEFSIVDKCDSPTVLTKAYTDTICLNENFHISVDAIGTGISYQWRKNEIDLKNEINSKLFLSNFSELDTGKYSCQIQGTCGSIIFDSIYLKLGLKPSILNQSQQFVICEKADTNLVVKVQGTKLNYQWKKQNSIIQDINSCILPILNSQLQDSGYYHFEINGFCGATISDSIKLIVRNKTKIISQSVTQQICEGSDVNLSVEAQGYNISYQWKYDGKNILNATSNSLSLSKISSTNNNLNYSCSVIGECGSEISNSIGLIINSKAIINYSNTNGNYLIGSSITPLTPLIKGVLTGNGQCQVSTFIGNTKGNEDGVGTNAHFEEIKSIVIDTNSNLYVSSGGRIRKITSNKEVSTLSISGESSNEEGTAKTSQFYDGLDIGLNKKNDIFILNNWGFPVYSSVETHSDAKLFKLTQDRIVHPFSGKRSDGFIDGSGRDSEFNSPNSITLNTEGNIFVADRLNRAIRKVLPNGDVTTFAGGGDDNDHWNSKDGISSAATFRGPENITNDQFGNLYVTDATIYSSDSISIRKITPNGVVSTIAGSSVGSVDAIGKNAKFKNTTGLTVDLAGNIYVIDENKIRKVTQDGHVTTIAGSVQGMADGSGLNAKFNWPNDIVADKNGDLYVADGFRIRKITQSYFSISPALPAGLNLDPKTGIISGTPSVETPTTTYTISTQNDCGISSDTVTFSTCSSPSIVYQNVKSTYLVNNSIQNITPSVNSSSISYSISPSLPVGLSFDSKTGIISGTPLIATSLTQYTINGQNPCGNNSTVISFSTEILNTNSLKENSVKSRVSVHPNPSKGIFTLSIFENSDLIITDVVGREVYKISDLTEGDQTINISNEPNGIYYLKIMSNSSQTIFPLVVSK